MLRSSRSCLRWASRFIALRLVQPVASDQIHQAVASTKGRQNFHRSPLMSQFQVAIGPQPMNQQMIKPTPMRMNAMTEPLPGCRSATGAPRRGRSVARQARPGSR